MTPAAPSTRSRIRRYLPLLGIALLAWVISRQDLDALGAALASVSPTALVQALGLFGVNVVLKALRWHRMLKAQKLPLPRSVAVAAFLTSLFYGQVTFGRVGELYKAEALIERGVPLGTALSSSLYDRLLDVALVLLVAAALASLLLGDVRAALVAGGCVLLLLAAGLSVLRARSLSRLGPVARLRKFLEGQRGTRGVLGLFVQLVSGLGPLLRPLFVLEAMVWTTVSWGFYFGSLWRVARGMGIDASFVSLTAGAALGALSALLPVTVSGIGAREVIFMHVLSREGVPGSRAVVLSLVHLSVMTVAAIGFGLLGLLARQRQLRASARVARVEGSRDS